MQWKTPQKMATGKCEEKFYLRVSVTCLFNNLIVNPKSKFLHVHNYIVLRAKDARNIYFY